MQHKKNLIITNGFGFKSTIRFFLRFIKAACGVSVMEMERLFEVCQVGNSAENQH